MRTEDPLPLQAVTPDPVFLVLRNVESDAT